MSLFSSIQLANNALRANQIGLQVTGQNIANANTPGYIREEVHLSPAPTQRIGNLLLGLGVNVSAVTQKIDRFLEERLRGARSDRTHQEVREQTFQQLESLYGELGDTDLSTSLNNFFGSIHDILNQPESPATRNLAVLKGKTLATDVQRLASRVDALRAGINKRIVSAADDINGLTERIRVLNARIAQSEGGDTSASEAVGLRDQRHQALTELAKLVDINVSEQPSGAVSVFVGGEYLVLDDEARAVEVESYTDRGQTVDRIRIAATNAPLDFSGGEVAGLVAGRDEILGTFLDDLNRLAGALAFEFNRLFSSGQGLNGYQSLVSESAVDSPATPLDEAGLPFTPVNGAFEVQVYNRQTGLTRTTKILVDLNGLDQDTSLSDLAASIDAIPGVQAAVDSQNRLVLSANSADEEFTFANDTSGVLAALGVNTFFSGHDAFSLSVHSAIAADPLKFAASRGGIGEDTNTAVDLANFLDRPLNSQAGQPLSAIYDKLTGDLTQGAAVAKSVAEGARVFEDALSGQSLAVSGVSIDEEVVRMIAYQRAFQASAKYISALDDLLQLLVNL